MATMPQLSSISRNNLKDSKGENPLIGQIFHNLGSLMIVKQTQLRLSVIRSSYHPLKYS